MEMKLANFRIKWMIIICMLVFSELLDLIVSFNFPSIKLFHFTTIAVIVCAIPFLLVTLKEMGKKSVEYEKNEQKLKNIYDSLDVAIWSHDLKTNQLFITQGIEKLYGVSLEDFYHDHALWKKVIFSDDLPIISEREHKIALGETVTSEYRIIRPNGEVRWIYDRGFPTLDSKGNFVYFSSVLFDITDRKESEDRYRSLVEMSPDIIAVVSEEKIEYINEAGWRLMGAAYPEELIGKSPLNYVPNNIIRTIRRRVGSYDNPIQERVSFEFQVKRLDGELIDVEMASTPILFEGRFAVQVVGRDITERKRAEQTIKKMAYYDALTGLPNRNSFKAHLTEAVTNHQHQNPAVLFLDLDRFKIINDTKGHSIGDIILQMAAGRLQGAVQQNGIVSRQGGDEFIILLEDTDKEQVTYIAEKILNAFSKPFCVNNQEFFVSTSIGISLYPEDGADEESLIKNADTAMYKAKERGNNFQFYSSSLNGISVRKMELENGLRKALEFNQLMLYYQPQFSLTTGEIVGMEALIRWDHPEHGFVSPSEFIPLAEETGLIVPIGKWVLREACRQRKDWSKAGIADFPIAVNVSVRQFEDDHFIEYTAAVLEEIGLDAGLLELEITESIMQNLQRSSYILHQLEGMGVLLSIDDFGTGYSSLSYLNRLPIHKIKIDKSFVQDVPFLASQEMLVKTIIDMGLNLNYIVIAEGIETGHQLEFLRQNDCAVGQGYLFSKPLPADEIEMYLERNKSGIRF